MGIDKLGSGDNNGSVLGDSTKGPFCTMSSTELMLFEKLNSKTDLEEAIKSQCGDWEDSRSSGWKNSYDYILNAVKGERVTESMLNVAAAKFPKKLHVQVVETYAKQLIANGEKLKAVNYLLLIGQHEKAIRILLVKGSYLDAIVLGKLHLDPNSKLMEEIYERAVSHFIKTQFYADAIKILCSIGKREEALAVNEKFPSNSLLRFEIEGFLN